MKKLFLKDAPPSQAESRKVVPFESFLPRALDMKTGNMYYERDVLEAAKKFAKQFEP